MLDIVKKAIVCAEEKNFKESFRLFDEALTQAPESPSILNDRAQALRLASRDEGIARNENSVKKKIKILLSRKCLTLYVSFRGFKGSAQGGGTEQR